MQPRCVKRQAFEGEVYLAIRNEGADIVRNEGGLIGANRPGNVRELEHRIEQALILSEGNLISFPDPERPRGGNMPSPAYGSDVVTLENLERDYIERILNMARWKVMGRGGAAAILGMKPTTLFSP